MEKNDKTHKHAKNEKNYLQKSDARKYSFCDHIKSHFLNNFIDKCYEEYPQTNFKTEDHNDDIFTSHLMLTNFYLFNNITRSHQIFPYQQISNYYDSFFVHNISLDWIALSNPQKLSLSSLNRDGCIFTLSFDDTGNTLASSNHNHNIEIWDMTQRKVKKIISDHKEIVTGLEFFHNNSEMLMSCSLDKTIKLWNNFENVHTFLDHSDWVRCLAVSSKNEYFLSGCVSSVVKLWDLSTQSVIASITNKNPYPEQLNTVNSLAFMKNNEKIFLSGLRNGSVKIYDTRLPYQNDCPCIVKEFKAHKNKLNSVKLNREDEYLLSSGRDSIARLWDIRKLPASDNPEINSFSAVSEYKGHKCSGYNIDCNFFVGEKYVITGSEDSFIYIYNTVSMEIEAKYKTHQKCVNLVKPVPDSKNYSFAFTGLEDISIFIWDTNKVVTRGIDQKFAMKRNQTCEEDSPQEDLMKYSEKDTNQQLYMKLIEDIMSECGDAILKIFHSNNLTYSNGMNFENLLEIIQKNNDQESLRIMNMLNEKFMKRIMESYDEFTNIHPSDNEAKLKHKSSSSEALKYEIKCDRCDGQSQLQSHDDFIDKNLCNMLSLPNINSSFDDFDEKNDKKREKDIFSKCEDRKDRDVVIIKTLYSNENISMKYNSYILNKFL